MTSDTPETLPNTVIIRLAGEIGTKAAWTRKLYERRLISNVKAVLKRQVIPYEAVTRRFGRIYLRTSQAHSVPEVLAKVFGISSLSPALQTTSDLSAIVRESVFLVGQRLHEGSSFAVRCRRVGKHAYSSTEVCRAVGRRILDVFSNLHLTVDLKRPDVTVGIEIRDDQAFIFVDVVKGAGGLPVGTQPGVVCLLDGDVSSSVACWLVMKRGCLIHPLCFDNSPFSGEEVTGLALEAARILFNWMVGFSRKVCVVSNGENLAEIQRKCPKRLTSVVFRRLLYRVAERVAETKGAEGIVSSESLGEPLDQTLRNIRLFDEAVKLYPIYRPLLGLSEIEVRQLAEKIGVHGVWLRAERGGGRVLGKAFGAVGFGDVGAVERRLNVDRMVERCVSSLRIVSV